MIAAKLLFIWVHREVKHLVAICELKLTFRTLVLCQSTLQNVPAEEGAGGGEGGGTRTYKLYCYVPI